MKQHKACFHCELTLASQSRQKFKAENTEYVFEPEKHFLMLSELEIRIIFFFSSHCICSTPGPSASSSTDHFTFYQDASRCCGTAGWKHNFKMCTTVQTEANILVNSSWLQRNTGAISR